MTDDEVVDPEPVEPPKDVADSHFNDLPREDYADIPDDVGEAQGVRGRRVRASPSGSAQVRARDDD
jgi:hypothetical protein